ncbi:hypothetical protein L1887_59087 [Cichorium endivia]|nr:hypothetical protein L1887_59087 [Cichorium endivia]
MFEVVISSQCPSCGRRMKGRSGEGGRTGSDLEASATRGRRRSWPWAILWAPTPARRPGSLCWSRSCYAAARRHGCVAADGPAEEALRAKSSGARFEQVDPEEARPSDANQGSQWCRT